MTTLEILFWLCASVILYTYVGYGSLLMMVSRAKGRPPRAEAAGRGPEPTVTLVVAAFDEGPWLPRKIENALELDYPEEKLGILLVIDGEMDEVSRQAARRSSRTRAPARTSPTPTKGGTRMRTPFSSLAGL